MITLLLATTQISFQGDYIMLYKLYKVANISGLQINQTITIGYKQGKILDYLTTDALLLVYNPSSAYTRILDPARPSRTRAMGSQKPTPQMGCLFQLAYYWNFQISNYMPKQNISLQLFGILWEQRVG